MKVGRFKPYFVFLFLLALAPLIPACSEGGGSSFFLVGIDYGGGYSEANLPRNQPIVLKFNASIDPISVHPEGLQVLRGATTPHEGRIVVDGRLITFYPTVLEGDTNNFSPANNPPLNAFGFLGNSTYQIKLSVASGPFTLLSSDGKALTGIGLGLPMVFNTSNGFIPEDPPVAPNVCSTRDYYTNHPEHKEYIDFAGTCDEPDDTGEFEAWKSLTPIFEPPPDPALQENLDQGDYWFFTPYVSPELSGITLVFDEPMNENTFNPRKSFKLINMDKGQGGEIVVATISHSPDGKEFTIHPEFSLGKGLPPQGNDPGGYEFTVSVGEDFDLNDLGGNELTNPQTFTFFSYYDPNQEDFNTFTVEFTGAPGGEISNGFTITEDPDNTTAKWPDDLGDFLEGADASLRRVQVIPTDTPFNVPQPLSTLGNRIQFIYTKGELNRGAPSEVVGNESIVGVSWGPRSNFVFRGIYQDIKMQMGHSSVNVSGGNGLDLFYEQNYRLGDDVIPPTVVYQGNYVCDALVEFEWFPWPTFTQDFEWNGTNSVAFDVNVPKPLTVQEGGLPTYQLFRNWSVANKPRRRVFGDADLDRANFGEKTVYHHLFYLARKISQGQSLWIEQGLNPGSTVAPEFLDPVVIADLEQQGTQWDVEFQGATEDVGGAVNVNEIYPPDGSWVEDLKALSYTNCGQKNEFIRFRFILRANLSTFSLADIWNPPSPGTAQFTLARIDSLSIAWNLAN